MFVPYPIREEVASLTETNNCVPYLSSRAPIYALGYAPIRYYVPSVFVFDETLVGWVKCECLLTVYYRLSYMRSKN